MRLSRARAAGSDDIGRPHRPDLLIALYTALLMLFGLVIIYSIGPQRAHILNESFGTNYSDMYFVVKQFINVGLAVCAFLAAYFIPFKFLLKQRRNLLYLGLGACLLLFIASLAGLGIADESYGATRWLNLGPLGSLQPSELLKLAVLIYLAGFLAARVKAGEVNDWRETLVPIGIVVAVAALFIIVIQKDLGTGVSLFAIVMMILVVSGISWRNLGIIGGIVVASSMLLIMTSPHRMSRVATFLNVGDKSQIEDANYHIEHAKIAIGTGGLLGVGIGNSVQATGYLPEAINDSVFAIMGETFGFLGLVATIALFIALFMRIVRVIEGVADFRLKLLASGVFGWLVAHFILNIGAMIGVLPLTGITLPLLSFGGTSMVFIAFALGLTYQISRFTRSGLKLKGDDSEGTSSRRRVRRSRYTSHSSAS